MRVNKVYMDYFASRPSSWVLVGGRRSGKTYAICQRILAVCMRRRRTVNVATMTVEQGRLGVYADMRNILKDMDANGEGSWWRALESPREIRLANGSRIFFNSYQKSETAKGVACDYLYINEANNFSEQHYIDLMANVRRGVFLDFNPNFRFWVDKYYNESDMLRTTWRDNAMLTEKQLEYFAKLKELGERSGASPVDVRNYKVYYCGEYAEIVGQIFSPSDFLHTIDCPALHNVIAFSDPSAMVGGDYFATVVVGEGDDGRLYLADSLSLNVGRNEDVARWLRSKVVEWGVERIFVETNGIIGQDFYYFLQNSDLPVDGWYSRGRKFDRIVANYHNMVDGLTIVDTPENDAYLEQVWQYAERCEHDDNVDALSSAVTAHRYAFA